VLFSRGGRRCQASIEGLSAGSIATDQSIADSPARPIGTRCYIQRSARSQHRGASVSVANSEDYRRYAVACLELAGTSHDRQARAVLAHMAQVWLRLADEKDDATSYNTTS
jgi:hypothetical protein